MPCWTVARALRQGGRFVGEFGGHGNVAAMRVALAAALERHGAPGSAMPLYLPRRGWSHSVRDRRTGVRRLDVRGALSPRRQSESRLTTIASCVVRATTISASVSPGFSSRCGTCGGT